MFLIAKEENILQCPSVEDQLYKLGTSKVEYYVGVQNTKAFMNMDRFPKYIAKLQKRNKCKINKPHLCKTEKNL